LGDCLSFVYKQAGQGYFFASLATAFGAANSSLILAFTTKKSIYLKAKSNVLFVCVGVCRLCGYFT
jgi:hypothetical protein